MRGFANSQQGGGFFGIKDGFETQQSIRSVETRIVWVLG
jgi:hypothetical protein